MYKFSKVSGDQAREIDTASSQIKVEGNRYPEHLEKMTGR
jgi:hypothetical protein